MELTDPTCAGNALSLSSAKNWNRADHQLKRLEQRLTGLICTCSFHFVGQLYLLCTSQGDTFMESFNGRFKGEHDILLHYDVANIWELMRAVAMQVECHNVQRRHSVLEYLAPRTYINQEVSLRKRAFDLAPLSS